MINKIYFDLDGVLANLDTAIARHLHLHTWVRLSEEEWSEMSNVPRLFYTLETLPESIAMIYRVIGKHGLDRVEILTALPDPTGQLATADADKRAWVRDHVHPEIVVNTVHGGKNKFKWLHQHPNSVLIDDYDRNIRLWEAAGGIGILHRDPHSTLEKLKVLGLL